MTPLLGLLDIGHGARVLICKHTQAIQAIAAQFQLVLSISLLLFDPGRMVPLRNCSLKIQDKEEEEKAIQNGMQTATVGVKKSKHSWARRSCRCVCPEDALVRVQRIWEHCCLKLIAL